MESVSYGNGSSENNSVSRQGSTLPGNDDDPTRRRSFSGVVRNIFDEEFRDSLKTYSNDPNIEKKYKELTGLLRKRSDEFENRRYSRLISYSDRTKNASEHLYPRYNPKYKVLERLVAEWKPNREKLIETLSFDTHKLDRNFKWSTIVRILASSVEVSGTVGGLMFRSETGWANHAFNVASFCGLCGLFSTVAEVEQSKRILDEVSEAIENDHRLLLPIVKWFEESEELNSIVQELFPHGIDTDIVRQIQAASAEQEDYLKIFKADLMSNVRKDNDLFENADFFNSLQLFATSKVAAVWWNRIVYRKHPIHLDLGRMALQIEFGQLQSIVFQCIPALPLEQQRLTSLPVAGRIMLNLFTLYDSFVDLKKGAKSTHSDKLRKQMKNMKEQLEMIEDTVRMMKPHIF
ncbi:hypothetical protein AVEN_189100-1 [Araneus ventricosus]|uniref:Uncharacterized protein n=1 Tax=Araneus ventricosus TaxID=182803 RepID=A0A4Y2HG40_ARAVE|nr:hypothetical protein AVEN_189100-1 [Araneus ventricosus]